MLTQTVTITQNSSPNIIIGRRSTYETQQVIFDVSWLIQTYGEGTATLLIKRPKDASAYPVVATLDGNTLTWTVSDTDTQDKGHGECEIYWYVNGGLAKSCICGITILRDIGDTTETAPDPYETWVDELARLGAETLANAQAAEQSANNAAQSASEAENSAAAALESEENALDSENAAKASEQAAAASEQGAEQSATAARQSATEAAQSATNAHDDATDASASADRAEQAAASIEGDTERAEAAAQTAQGAASDASGFAGTASTKATEAAGSAATAEQAATTATQKAADASASATAADDSASSASASATAAGNAQTAAETAQGKAEDAQEAAETAAQSIEDSAAQIDENTADILNLKSALMDSDYFSFFDLAWENGSLDNNGAEIADSGTNTRYRTAFIQPNSFETLVLFIPRFCYCYGYRYDSSKRFLGFVAGGWLGATATNQDGIVKIQSDGETAFYRFVFRAWTSYSGVQRAITSNDLANTYCFHINRFPVDKSENSNLPFVVGAMEDYRNLTIPTNTTRANSFFVPVSSKHMVLSVPNGYQIYTWQFDGDFQYLRERGWSTGCMYYYLEENTKYIRFVAKTDNGSDTPSTEALKAVSVSFLSEIDKVPVNPLLRENTLIAHRGYSQTAPENTIPAIELAAQYGFKQVEVDLQFTSDGVCVLLHDNTVNRTSDGTGNIYDMTYEQALQYDFGSWKSAEYAGTKIPTLKEALLCCKYYGMCAQLDIADTNKTNITAQNLQTMLDVIAETGMFANVNICAEDDRARKVLALHPGLILCTGVGDTEAKFNTHKDMVKGCALLIGSNSVATSTDAMMERCHKNGMPYQIWTIDTADAAIAKFKAGYDWIITNSLKPTDVS